MSHVEKPLRKLRKKLDAFPANPDPEQVHSLRTQTRRLEATVAALARGRDKRSHRLAKLITPVRKAAGKVRDMDVLIGDVLTLDHGQGSEGLVLLVEHLAKIRLKGARKLHEVIDTRRRAARKELKQSTRFFRKQVKDGSSAGNEDAPPQILIAQLSHWPDLDSGNLHPFRIRVKELRYMLQLAESPDEKLIDRLGHVKDVIGEWHDWVELMKIAKKVLDAGEPVLDRIDRVGKEKFHLALAAANQLRDRYFEAHDARASRRTLEKASGF